MAYVSLGRADGADIFLNTDNILVINIHRDKTGEVIMSGGTDQSFELDAEQAVRLYNILSLADAVPLDL